MKFFQIDIFSLFRKPQKPARKPRQVRVVEDPGLKHIWAQLQQNYFPARPELLEFRICWSSRRQLRTLASCNSRVKKVNVARELNAPDCARWLEPLLYHEMCHAVLADAVRASKGAMTHHGKEFKNLERRHPGISDLNRWIRSGGWLRAIRSDRAREVHARKKAAA